MYNEIKIYETAHIIIYELDITIKTLTLCVIRITINLDDDAKKFKSNGEKKTRQLDSLYISFV